jgi:hypothetical protein
MKVTRDPPAGFQPITLTITVETPLELQMLQAMCRLDQTLPQIIAREMGGQIGRMPMENFLKHIRDVIDT